MVDGQTGPCMGQCMGGAWCGGWRGAWVVAWRWCMGLVKLVLGVGGGMDGDAGEVVITLESRCLPGVGGGVLGIRTQPNC